MPLLSTEIKLALEKLVSGPRPAIVNPDKTHNIGNLLGIAFMWDEIQKIAGQRSKEAWKALEENGIVNRDNLSVGEHVLADSPHFAITAKVANPPMRFNADELVGIMYKSKYKVPAATMTSFIDQAKREGTGSVTLKVMEKVTA